MSKFTENSEWIIEDMPAERHVEYYNCCPEPYPDITYYINMKVSVTVLSEFLFSCYLT